MARVDHLQVGGAVLTGGASRRMGRDKATLAVDGVAMAQRVAGALARGGCDPVVLVGGDPQRLTASLGLPVVADLWPGEGPLGGIIAALRTAQTPVLVAACDLPWLDAASVAALIATAAEHHAVDVVHATTSRAEPLCALWRPSALPALEAAFASGERAMHRALGAVRSHPCPVDGAALVNVNEPSDLERR